MTQKRWKISDLGKLVRNSLAAIVQGKFLLTLNAGRYLTHIAYTFFLLAMAIWISLMIETTMARVESNKEIISELQIANSQKVYEMTELGRRSSVERRLSELGSEVKEAEKPAYVIVGK